MAKTQRRNLARALAEAGADSLALTAYRRIKQAILIGRLHGGEYLNVARLCEEMELGRSPVHLAVHRLAFEGLIEIRPRKGVAIRADSLEDFLQISEARALLAPALAGMAARRADGKAIGRMERHLLALKPGRREREALILGDLAFHEELFTAAGNGALAQIALRLHERALRSIYASYRSTMEMSRAADRLQAVLVSVRSGDEQGAVAAMRRHVEAATIASNTASARNAAL